MLLKLITVIVAISLIYADDEFKGDKVLRIFPKTESDVKYLEKLVESENFELDVWNDVLQTEPKSMDIHVKAGDVESVGALLKENGIMYTFMIDNLADIVREEALSNHKHAYQFGFDYNKYNTYSNIVQELKHLTAMHSNKAEIFSVGSTYEGELMTGIKITNGGRAGSKPVIWIDGGIHAREWISPATVMWFIRYLLTDRSIATQKALNKYDFYILPVFNADGYKHTHLGGRARMWRKTRKPNYGSRCMGTDPNRNWDYGWGRPGASSNPCSDSYRGTRAFSEVEVANVAGYLKRIPNLKAYFNVHSYSQLVLTPWGYTRTLPRDYYEMKRVGDVFANSIRSTSGISYRTGSPANILYAASGGSMDYTYGKLGVVYSYGLELRDTGRYGFILPAWYIPISGKETSIAFIAAVNAMH